MTVLDARDPRWREFVEGAPEATLFHHPAWSMLLAECFGYRARAFVLIRGGAIVAGFPFLEIDGRLRAPRWVSLPFTDHCEPLVQGDAGELAGVLAELVARRRVDYVELRGPLPESDLVRPYLAFVRHELPLQDGDLARGLSSNHRRNIRLAEREAIRIDVGASADDVDTFYRLHLRTRTRLGVPVQPRRFFRLLSERILSPGLGFIVTARHGDVPVAAAVFGAWNRRLIYKYGARDERYQRLGANHLLFWTVIQRAREDGFVTLDFGRSDLDHALLRQFKAGWGAREAPLVYTRISREPARASTGRAQAALGAVIRRSGPWLCRAVGELFYRYAA